MREDMYKVIVERPRRGKDGNAAAARLRNDFNGPARLRARAGYGYRSLNENLSPLRRYLRAQTGRPWDKVFSEICANIDRRNTVQQHIHQHIRDFIAIDIGIREGQWVDLTNRRRFLPSSSGIYQELYVDPSSGLVRLNKDYHSWRQSAAKRRQREQAEITARRRTLDGRTLLLLLDDVWFRVEVDARRSKAGNVYFEFQQAAVPLPHGLDTSVRVEGATLDGSDVRPSQSGHPTREFRGGVSLSGTSYVVTAFITQGKRPYWVKVHAHKGTSAPRAEPGKPQGGRIA